jgi:uncharacterized protein (DUF983 family)
MIAARENIRPDRWTVIARGLRQRCPRCGEGALFRSYLKLSDRCDRCGEALGDIRADDGPAWATILVVGHLMVPFFLIAMRADAPNWVVFGVLMPATIGIAALLLPRAKGLFAALLWSLDMRGGEPG